MGLIHCFSSAGFSLRQRFKTNRLSVGTTWKWFQWGFIQPSSHHGSENIRVPSASEVFAGGVGGSDKRRGCHLRWLGFWEAAHHLHCSATAYCASSNEIQHQSRQLSPLPCGWSSERAVTGNYKITLSKNGQGLRCHLKKKKTQSSPTHTFPTTTTKKLTQKPNPPFPILQLLALVLFTLCCTQGIYI